MHKIQTPLYVCSIIFHNYGFQLELDCLQYLEIESYEVIMHGATNEVDYIFWNTPVKVRLLVMDFIELVVHRVMERLGLLDIELVAETNIPILL